MDKAYKEARRVLVAKTKVFFSLSLLFSRMCDVMRAVKNKAFTSLGDAEKLQSVGPLVREYQHAVDTLTKRCSASEEVLKEVNGAFALVSDPAPVFVAVTNGTGEVEQLKGRVKRAEEQFKALQVHVLQQEAEIATLRASGGGGGAGTVVEGASTSSPSSSSSSTDEKLRQELVVLQQENAGLKQKVISLEADVVRTATQLGDAKLKLAELESGGGGGGAEVAALKTQLAQVSADATASKGEVEKLRNSLKAKDADVVRSSEALAVTKAELAQVTQRLETVQQSAGQSAAELKKFQEEALQYSAMSRGFEEQIATLKQAQLANTNASTALQAKQLEIESLQQLSAQHTAVRQQLEEQIETLKLVQEAELQNVRLSKEADVKAARDAAASLQASSDLLAQEMELLKQELALQTQVNEEQAAELTTARQLSKGDDGELKKQLEASNAAVQALRTELESQRAITEEAKRGKVAVEAKLMQVQTEAKLILAAVDQEQQRSHTLQDDYSKLKQAFDEWKSQAQDSSKAKEALEEATRDAEAQRTLVLDLQQQVATANAVRNELATALEHTKAQLEEERLRVSSTQHLHLELEQAREQIKESNAAANEMAQEIDRLKQTGQQSVAKVLQALQASLGLDQAASFDSVLDQVSVLQMQRSTLQGQMADLREKLARVQKDYDDVRATADSALDAVRSEAAKKQQEIDALSARLPEVNEWKQKAASLEAALESTKGALADVKQKSSVAIKELREKNAQLTAKISELAATDAAASSEATRELRAQNAELQKKMSDVLSQLERTRKQDEEILAKNRELMTNLEFLEAENVSLKESARSSAAAAAAASSVTLAATTTPDLESMRALEMERAKNAEQRTRVFELEKEVETLGTKSDHLSSRCTQLEAELTKAASAHTRDANQSKELESLRRDKKQLERDNREHLELVERLQKEKFETLELYSQSQRACEKLTSTVTALEAKVAKYELSGGGGGAGPVGAGPLVSINMSAAGPYVTACTNVASNAASAGWRRAKQCMPPLSSLPTVQRVTSLFAGPKEKADDSFLNNSNNV